MSRNIQSTELPVGTPDDCIKKALTIAVQFGGIDGGHHKAWVLDQMARALTACPLNPVELRDYKGVPYTYLEQGESQAYLDLVADARNGEDGPETYDWELGIAP